MLGGERFDQPEDWVMAGVALRADDAETEAKVVIALGVVRVVWWGGEPGLVAGCVNRTPYRKTLSVRFPWETSRLSP
jgi:hypothetical protein